MNIVYHVEVYDSPEFGWVPVDQRGNLNDIKEARDHVRANKQYDERRGAPSKYRIVKSQLVQLAIVK